MNLPNKELYKYSALHADEFPVSFHYNYEWNIIQMFDRKACRLVAEMDGNSIRIIYDDNHNTSGWMRISEACEHYGLNYNLDNPQDILNAIVDISYNKLKRYVECITDVLNSIKE